MRAGKVNLWVLFAGLALCLPFLWVLAKGFGTDPRSIDSPLIGRAAPDFTLSPIDGSAPVSLRSLRGKPVVLNFWATWCQPCKAEHGTLLRLARQVGTGASFLGVVYQDEPAKILAWLDRYGAGYPTLVDVGSQAAIAFGVYGVPETYVIDAEGVIRHKIAGEVSGPDVLEQLALLGVGR